MLFDIFLNIIVYGWLQVSNVGFYSVFSVWVHG